NAPTTKKCRNGTNEKASGNVPTVKETPNSTIQTTKKTPEKQMDKH
ncbi:16143_t:CDS:1, partial [Gigaspora rosea]